MSPRVPDLHGRSRRGFAFLFRRRTVCNRRAVENLNPHDALGDAVATAECYRRLVSRYQIYG